ncbi:MAG: T9SS type A sorting domain-containing protein [candidate division WOR-3 bacterium]|nr:MAG: T9SS type A sorting domain-containing protein [candidate division WOR-3 bacterium]
MRIVLSICCLLGVLSGQILYEEYFTDGNMALDWSPWFTDTSGVGDSMQVVSDPTTPGGDSWAGSISNEYMGVSGLTYAGENDMTDYSVEAWIYTVVMPAMGPYNGLAIRCDSSTGWYYRFISDFDSDARLRLALFTGGMGATVIRDWAAGEIPGGVPATSSWHKFKLQMVGDSIWAWYDDVLLPDCPLQDDSIANGFFGVYVFNMVDTASTRCDDIIVTDVTGINEYGNTSIRTITAAPNPFTSHVTIHSASAEHVVRVYDATGSMVREIPVNASTAIWNGRDQHGIAVVPGVYFITDNDNMEKVIKVR